MALMITDACTACDACEPVCPNKAISVGNPIYVIDPMKCTECVGAEDEPQCKLVCPAECIVPNPDWSEDKDQLLAKQAVGEIAYQALSPGEENDHEADHHAGKRQRKGQHRDQNGTTRETMPLQEHPGNRCHDQGHDGGRGGKQDGVDKRCAVARLGQDRKITREPLRSACPGYNEPRHWQQEKCSRQYRKRQQA